MSQRHMITRSKTKSDTRSDISHDIDNFLSGGGEVKDIPTGVSGNENNINLFTRSTNFEPKKDRTPLTETIQEMDARKKEKKPAPKASKKPRKILITDDFGEPVRWVWEE